MVPAGCSDGHDGCGPRGKPGRCLRVEHAVHRRCDLGVVGVQPAALRRRQLVDVGKASHKVGAVIAVLVSALAFAVYHPLDDGQGGISAQKLCFFFIAGLYFGAVYVMRGFGIVVGVHALYDVITVSMLSSHTN